MGGASVTLLQAVLNQGRRVFEAEVTVVLVAVSGKPLRLSSAIRDAFGAAEAPTVKGPSRTE
jgi:acyl-CoA thioester hydrolase